jgi:hypothetical protein
MRPVHPDRRHALGDELPQRLADPVQRHRSARMLSAQLAHVPVERRLAGQALEEHHGRGVEVGPRGGGLGPPQLRGTVAGRSGRRGLFRGRRHHPEVGQLDLPGLVDQHVPWSAVAVNEAEPVHRGQCEQHPLEHGQRCLRAERTPALDQRGQRDPADQLHDHRGARARLLDEVVDAGRGRNIDPGELLRLGPEADHEGVIAGQRRAEVLDRHPAAGFPLYRGDDASGVPAAEFPLLGVAG